MLEDARHRGRSEQQRVVVVAGEGCVRLRKIDSSSIIEIFVNDKELEVIDIPPGYTHHIENIGKCDLVLFIWANECYDAKSPDAFYLCV